jgi:very-short-patch-repair endonuclease
MESALRRCLVNEIELANAVAVRPTVRPGADVLAACLARRPAGAPATESYLETRGVQLLRRAGLPTGRRQVEVRDHRGAFVARVDLLLEERLVVEFDGREHHARVETFEPDRARWDRLAATGLAIIMFTADHVERRPRVRRRNGRRRAGRHRAAGQGRR